LSILFYYQCCVLFILEESKASSIADVLFLKDRKTTKIKIEFIVVMSKNGLLWRNELGKSIKIN